MYTNDTMQQNCFSMAVSDESTVQERNLLDNSNLFVWDGKQVGGEIVRTGQSCEPVLLRVTCPRTEGEEGAGQKETNIGRHKDSTLGDLRVTIYICFN